MKNLKSALCLMLVALLCLLPFAIIVNAEEEEEKEAPNFMTDLGVDWKIKEDVDIEFAEHFQIFHYENGSKLIACSSGESYLITPEGLELPEELSAEITILPISPKKIYLANTAAMSYLDELDCLDAVAFSSLEADKWYIENAKKAMEEGKMEFAGKYREPDYEILSANECDLVLFNTGIRKVDKVLQMFDNLEIQYLIDLSSQETHPLGRVEWLKVYAALFNKEELANELFQEAVKQVEELKSAEASDLTVAFFFINKDGDVLAYKSGEYISKMIELAGGKYNFEDSSDLQTDSVYLKLEMEHFYTLAKDADFIIYNGMTHGAPESLDEILALNPLLEDFKAVQENHVYAVDKNFYQESSKLASMILDIQKMLSSDPSAEDDFLFLSHLTSEEK